MLLLFQKRKKTVFLLIRTNKIDRREKKKIFVFNMIYTEFEYLFMKSISSYNFKTSKNIINDWETLINKFMKGLDSVDPDKEIINILN